MYKLKPNVAEFEMVDGPFTGRKYRHGEQYREVPPQYEGKFTETAGAAEGGAPVRKGGKDK
jgi:hypothetical protein